MIVARKVKSPSDELKIARQPDSRCTSASKIGAATQERMNTTSVSA